MPQDFSRQNLRGRNFKGLDLTGANFSHADIRSANFTNAILKGANFSHAKAGLQRRWAIVLVIASLILSALSGLISAFASFWIAFFFIPAFIKNYTMIPGAIVLIVIAAFFVVTIRKGLVIVAVVATGVASAAEAGVASAAEAGVAAAAAAVGAAAAASGVAIVAAISSSTAIAVIAAAGAAAGAGPTGAAAAAATAAVAVAGLGIFVAWRTLVGDEKHAFVRKIAVAFAATGGTSFRGADLTDANFNQARLKNTDFRKANLTRTRFYDAQKLNLARVGNSILANQAVVNLLVTGDGKDQSYIGANLRGANLIGADLKKADLREAVITEATFQGANLEWANLTLTQAVGTDFTNARMTGVCVEAWNIEDSTKLDNVDCRFVYLLERPKPGADDRERRPSSGEFKPGEFTKLFEEVLNTVDLIFDKGIDWKAFVAAFKKVQVEHEDTELAIQSIENKGDGVVVVRVSVPPNANKEKIHSDFMQNYQLALKEVEKYKELYEDQLKKYSDMYDFGKLLITAIRSHQVNVNNKAIATSESNLVQETNQYNLRDTTVSGSNIGTNHGTQIGTQHNYAAEQNLAEAAAEIQQLLEQLSQTYPTNTRSEQMVVVDEALKRIEGDPTLKERVIGAIKSGGIEAFKEAINHPLVNILVAFLQGWQTGN